eukprot:m.247792 g.247792  ORF g.247792 m.247792 type:complete len:60 (-) comp85997_c0_seq1:441-620(-)
MPLLKMTTLYLLQVHLLPFEQKFPFDPQVSVFLQFLEQQALVTTVLYFFPLIASFSPTC